jgi:hypothetical protein
MPTPSIIIVPDRYKSGVLYSQLPESGAVDFDVTRATTAFRTNASGILESVASGVPRLDYPAAGGCPSLLVEPAATNLLLRSEEFDNASWVAQDISVTPNTSISPDGATTGDKIVEAATTSTHFVAQSLNLIIQNYTFSIYAKQGERQYLCVSASNVGSFSATFDLSAGTVVGSNNAVSASIQNVGNGWYRCVVVKNVTATGSSALRIGTGNSATVATAGFVQSYTGDGTSGIFIWGAQVETGSVATSYIPTVAATATRNADVISKTGVSGFIGQTQGTLYAEVLANNFSATNRRVLCISSSANDRIVLSSLIGQQNRYQAVVVTGGSVQAQIVTTIDYAENTPIKMAVAYANNDVVFYVNGVQIGTDTSATIPVSNRVDVGSQIGVEQFINGRIRAAAIYPTRLTNSQLQSLTTL